MMQDDVAPLLGQGGGGGGVNTGQKGFKPPSILHGRCAAFLDILPLLWWWGSPRLPMPLWSCSVPCSAPSE